MTTRKVRIRISEHRSTFRCRKDNTRLTRHYLEKGHSENDLKWAIIEKFKGNTPNVAEKLLYYEQRWIFRLKANVLGLNDDIQWSQLYH